eukprot:5418803-Pleurochrysis_carterae.AAC.1
MHAYSRRHSHILDDLRWVPGCTHERAHARRVLHARKHRQTYKNARAYTCMHTPASVAPFLLFALCKQGHTPEQTHK